MLSRDSTSTWTSATRSATPARTGGAPGLSFSRATRSSCRFSPCGGARNSSLSSQSMSVNSNRVRPVGEEAQEEGLEELLEQHLEALVVIGGVGLGHDGISLRGTQHEDGNGRTTGQPFGTETTRHDIRTAGFRQLGFTPAAPQKAILGQRKTPVGLEARDLGVPTQ